MSSAPPPPPPPTSAPAPPERGWYPVPGKPDYQHFWDGLKWTSQRYWGGSDTPGVSAAPSGPPPAGPPPPAGWRSSPPLGSAVRYRDFFGVPLNPRSPARKGAVACVALVIGIAYVRLHIFPWQLLALFFGAGLLLLVLRLPGVLRYQRDPARQAAIRKDVVFESQVWLRFTFAPTRWAYPVFSRWDLAVRADSFQVTNWIWGQRDRARSTFFQSEDATMWRAIVDGRDCIVVSGPTYKRSKVEFSFSTDGRNARAWDALAASGARVAASPSPAVPVVPEAAPARTPGFTRRGSDLGSRHERPPAPPQPATAEPVAAGGAAASADVAGPGRSGLKPPLLARQHSGARIAVMVVAVLLAPFVLATLVRLSLGRTQDTQAASLRTTQCSDQVTAGFVVWRGVVTTNSAIRSQREVRLIVTAVLPNRTVAGQTNQEVPVTTNAGQVPVGPIDVAVTGKPAAVECQAYFAYPDGIG